jgi:hypothetical protein
MTTPEPKALTAARAAYARASKRVDDARKARDLALRAAEARLSRPLDKARNAARVACAKVTRLELAAAGITPMHTIVLYKGKAYALCIKRDGWARMLLVRKDNRLFEDAFYREEIPPSLDRLQITTRILTIGDDEGTKK